MLSGGVTLDQAQMLGTLGGAIGNGPAGNADVDWYAFTLAGPSAVHLSAAAGAGQSAPVLSLYNNDPFDFADPYDPLGHRLLGQESGSAISVSLAAGTYYVAVSGAGNDYFNPFLADSGYPGRPCTYDLQLSAAGLNLAGDGPVVLSSNPAAGAQLSSSPLVLRLDMSGAIDPNTVQPDQTVELTFNPTGQFGDGSDQAVALSNVNFSAAASELQLTPQDALAPGYYRIFLAGNSSGGAPVLADLNGTPLGTDAAHPLGQDFSMTFQVTGVEGVVGAVPGAGDDTAATAHELGDVTAAGLVQAVGAIGDDPAYNFNSSNPLLTNPAAQVDLYHFTISGSGPYALTSEVFAGRIGSPLDAGLSLFEADPGTGQLRLVAANDNSLNDTAATNGTSPLFTDPVLFAGLTAGNYYLAVSGTGNVPDPTEGQSVGVNGVFDPNAAHSGMNGFTTGDYVLNLAVTKESAPPQVVSVSLNAGAVLTAPPSTFTVQFSESVNLRQLAIDAFQQSPTLTLDAVYVQDSGGAKHYAQLVSYDATTNQAVFLLTDAVPNGPAQLHLSGAGSLGIIDTAGSPLVPSPGGGSDYVVSFTVAGPARGTGGNPLLWTDQEPNDSAATAQVLGVLFPDELQQGVTVQRSAGASTSDTADYYQFQVLQPGQYVLSLSGTGLPVGALPTLTDASGNVVTGVPQGQGGAVRFDLAAGTYTVCVGGWTASQAASVQYKLQISLAIGGVSPPSLTVGPAPAIQIPSQFIVVGEFPGYGVQRFVGPNDFVPLTVPGVDASLLAEGADGTLVGKFSNGVNEYESGTTWTLLTQTGVEAPTLLAVDAVGHVFAEFKGYGVQEYVGGQYWIPLNVAGVDAALLTASGNGMLVADFTGYGVERYVSGKTWVPLSSMTADATVLAMNNLGDVVGQFVGGVQEFLASGGVWTPLTSPGTASPLAIDSAGDVAGAFPTASSGLQFVLAGSGAFQPLNASLPIALAVDDASNVFAGFSNFVDEISLTGAVTRITPNGAAASILVAD